MKNIYILLLIVGFFSCTQNSSTPEVVTDNNASGIISKKLNTEDFKKAVEKSGKAQLIDVRTMKEWDEDGHIDGATNIDFYQKDFKNKMEKLDKNKPVHVYCRSGGRSERTAEMLVEMGFKEVYDLDGGFTAWESGE